MIDFNSTDSLDWKLVLKELAKNTSSELGREYCLNLPLANNLSEAQRLQKQTSEAIGLLESEGAIPLGGFRNIKRHLEELEKGALLQGITFLDISSTLRSVRNLKSFVITKLPEDSELYALIFPLYTNQTFEREIDNAFSSDGSVLDSASPELYKIRISIKQVQQNLRESLTRLMQDSRYKNVVQETIITQRNGRYVIPVKSESQSSIKGIVQDQSQSGATVYLEPLSVVDDNNKLARKIVEEKVEIEKILREFGNRILPDASLIIEAVEKMTEVDVIVAKANYSLSIHGKRPAINDYGMVDLHKVKHPVLISQKKSDNVVPVDILLGKTFDTMIITGSNTGGKTVTLKTLGLSALMVKAGLYISTRSESDMAFFNKILADIGDEQSLEQNLSTFSGHLVNINKIIQNADKNSLVLLDEIGTGTDPTEGAAIARSVIEILRSKGAKVLVTTHYGELKTLAYDYPGISNASVEFDVETLSPTYRLLNGVPGKSNAIHIARRLGVDDAVIKRADELLNTETKDVTNSIEMMEKEYNRLSEERAKFELLNKNLTEKEKFYTEKLSDIEEKKRKLRDKLYEEFESEIATSLEDVRKIVKELQTDKTSQNAEIARQVIKETSDKVKTKHKKEVTQHQKSTKPVLQISKGDYYYLERLSQVVQVISEPRDKKVEVQAGAFKIMVDIQDLTKADTKESKFQLKHLKHKGSTQRVSVKTAPARESYRNSFNECDLRGLFVEDALIQVEKFIDESVVSGITTPLYIIHGKGTGALRTAIRDYLQGVPYIDSFRRGEIYEGGEGISVVYLKHV